MGIIQRQGLKRSILTYLGVGIGAFSTLFIYPLELEAFGMAQFLISTAAFFATFAAFGVNALPVRFFPVFENPQRAHNGFLGFLLAAAVAGLLLFWSMAALFRADLYRFIAWIGFDVPLFEKNMPFILLICFAIVFAAVLEAYISNFKRVAVPSIFTNLFVKIGLPCTIFLLYKGVIGESGLNWSLTGIFFSVVFALIWYLRYLGEWHIRPAPSFLTRPLLKEMTSYALFGILGSFGSVIAFRIDTIMVASMTGALNSGIYNIANFIANVIEIPFNAIIAIMSPLLAAALMRQQDRQLDDYYRKGSLNLMILGVLFYILAITSLDDLFRITPRYEELVRGKEVVWYLGLSKVFGMIFGIASAILSLSKFYRLSLLPLLLLAGINVALNFVLIPRFQMMGAAMATAISIVVFHGMNVLLVWRYLGRHPFSRGMISVLALGLLAAFTGWQIPGTGYPLLNIAMKSTVVTALFIGPVLYFRISPELNDFLIKNLAKARGFLGKKG
ncbi:MAG: lipopolysaccharide biosynthesis protein [Saprospiraceae bacterium]